MGRLRQESEVEIGFKRTNSRADYQALVGFRAEWKTFGKECLPFGPIIPIT
jgi:hypothetical protein